MTKRKLQTATATAASVSPGPGRPRNFDEAQSLERALEVFWNNGYEATSLDDLTAAMGISRSSFYATFGSKQALLMRALTHYSKAGLKRLREVASQPSGDRLANLLTALASPDGEGRRGCLMVNCMTELVQHDQEVEKLSRRHLDEVARIFAELLAPDAPETAMDKANAYSALAIGTIALRKSGLPPEQINQMLQQGRTILPD